MMTNVWISRVRVTGGFLEGLDVGFDQGLNVVIGGRGAGKTTLLELIGHALGTSHADKKRQELEFRRVRSMLGDGEVVVDIEDDDSSYRLIVDAEGGGRRPEFADNALLLGQNELETIASDADSRLRLIDFRAKAELDMVEDHEIEAMTRELFSMRDEIRELQDKTDAGVILRADLEILANEEKEMMADASASLTARRETLRNLENSLLTLQSHQAESRYAQSQINTVADSFSMSTNQVTRLLGIPLPPEDEEAVRPALSILHGAAEELERTLDTITGQLRESESGRAELELELRSRAEPIRNELNEAERGLGELTSRIRRVRAELERAETEKKRLAEIAERYQSVLDKREKLLDKAELVREKIYNQRDSAAANVSRDLSSRITVSIEHLADSRRFREFLSAALQGSGLKYASLAESLSKNLLPRQLLNYIETRDIESATNASELPTERVARTLEWLDSADVLAVLSVIHLEDMADFLLLDGAQLKSVESLSTGQKCAVTLPILLTEHERTLLLDQPEDHLDNAFLVDSIVVGLNKRSASNTQTIVATHNANIPVLGSAGCVIQLVSDGRRGSVVGHGTYNDQAIVEAITSLMEGGEEAFRRRAAFYRGHGIQT
ncbi:AAA family ATPase [Mycobacteroides chelonae]|uniref:AAA family ATPase n=1 Tax=Mycobacteroides chelonae TaxID=1774 RepID=UPI0004ABC5F7|nr:AAA family ATPase [Mycobacteroides chelonae]MBF9316381.1 AAA family ATPase [Mycobacteroides chelonae]OHT67743.1 hypothetical protein BKG66_24220 [Mycobacteroides chelonae]OHT69385.1 hypothetical protein BKG67_22755 [Mycobacteroides chelonae]OHT84303.1 hypothetical protein BKG70_22910 [Mycobacteroides chelonae]